MAGEHNEHQYNVYFAGELLPGRDAAQVRADLGKRFKAGEETLDKLFSGTPQLIKRRCDKATALKYKQALEQAGARPVIKRIAGEVAPSAPPEPESPSAPEGGGTLALAPAGTAVLRPEERRHPAPRDIDTSAFTLDAAGERLAPRSPHPPPAPDTGHLSLGAPGEPIPALAAKLEAAEPDTSAYSLAPAGSDVLEPRHRRQHDASAPDVSHIQLDDIAPGT